MIAGRQMFRNGKERKEWARRLQSENPGLEVFHPHAAWDRRGEQHALCCGATGSRPQTSTTIRVFYGRSTSFSRLAAKL